MAAAAVTFYGCARVVGPTVTGAAWVTGLRHGVGVRDRCTYTRAHVIVAACKVVGIVASLKCGGGDAVKSRASL